MASPKPIALYPTQQGLQNFDFRDFPQLQAILKNGDAWWLNHWQWGREFLSYIGRNKSEHTYNRFRNETERFLQWLFLIKKKPLAQLRKTDILDYADFCWQPPLNWICFVNADKFTLVNGCYLQNKAWAPFKLTVPKFKAGSDAAQDKKKYKPSQQTLAASFTAIVAFYKYLNGEEILQGNPAQLAKADCKYFVRDAQVKEVRRLSQEQWQTVFDVALAMADQNPNYERNLFVICALKTLFLRVSELSERKTWRPQMGHFWQDSEQNWWLKIYGKGRKLRDITVPQSFLVYLKRYREYRGLSPLPSINESDAIVEKIRGRGGMTSRQLIRIVQDVLDRAYEKLRQERGEDAAQKLREASSHWLRHTGASMEVERGRALKDLSEDLGHASMATTDTIYVQTESRVRAKSGKSRPV